MRLLILVVTSMLSIDARLAEKKIVIVTCSYNNRQWYTWNLDSIRTQKYTNYTCIYIDDCSSDGTADLVQEYIDTYNLHDTFILVRNSERKGAMCNQYTTITTYCNDDDIIIICDGDDRFAHRAVLSRINKIYSTLDVWLTYGQFKEYPSGEIGFCRPMPVRVIIYNAFRSYLAIPSHLRTFYAGLFKKIRVEDLMYEGEFLPMVCDIATMFPMIEMARDHFQFIPEVLLEYNAANELNDHKVSRELQRSLDLVIRNRPRYKKVESLF
jgi:glycosyltransferase involved in cell wall biosynthesis